MAVNVTLSPVFNGQQFFDDDGLPLSGGKIFQYVAGSFSSQYTSYTTSSGDVANANPIVLDSSGRYTEGQIWLEFAVGYQLVLTKPDGTTVLQAEDDITGVVIPSSNNANDIDVWVLADSAPTYVSSTSFILVGNAVQEFAVGNRVRSTLSDGTQLTSTVTAVVFSDPNTQVTIQNDSTAIDPSLTTVEWSSLTAVHNTIDAGGVHYTTGLTYAVPNTVGNALRVDETAIALGAATTAAMALVNTTASTDGITYTITPNPANASYTTSEWWPVLFNIVGGVSPTLNVNGLGAVALVQYDYTGAKVTPTITAGMQTDVMYDGTNMVIIDPLPQPPQSTAQPHGNSVFSSNGTFVVPDGVTAVKVTCVGAGGGGGLGTFSGGESTFSVNGGTGGSGGIAIGTGAVTPGASITIVVGAGGGVNPATPGGTTTFASTALTASGGGAGGDATGGGGLNPLPGANGANGIGGGTDLAYGTVGTTYAIGSSTYGNGGAGGDGNFSVGTVGRPGLCIVEW